MTFDIEPKDPVVKRRRANSENIQLSTKDMLRIQSDTDLLGIDKEKTFTASAIVKPAELLARVVNVLGGLDQPHQRTGINLFDDNHILANEKPPYFSIGRDYISNSPRRTRALSVAVPNYRKESIAQKINHDFTWTNGDTGEKFRKEANMRSGKLSLPSKVPPNTGGDNVQPQSLISRLFFGKSNPTESPSEYIKNTMKNRISTAQASNENTKDPTKSRRGSMFPSFGFGSDDKNDVDAYKEKTKRGRHSIFPTFNFNRDEDSMANAYLEKTKSGRHSIFPTFDFTEDEDEAATRAYQQKTKRHSIFPSFDFSEDEDAVTYREKTKSGRHSIFPTFDFSDPDDDMAQRYKEHTRRGRRSIFPTFNFSGLTSNDEDTVDEEEVKKYQNKTKKGRLSLFPTFGKSKKNDDDVMPESSDELVDYKNKTHGGRSSLCSSIGNRYDNSPIDGSGDLASSIKQYHKQKKHGRNSVFGEDYDSGSNSDDRRGSLFSNDLENYRYRTARGRPSLFDPDVNISNLPQSEQVEVLEHTSVADLLRALAVLETVSQGPYNTISSEPPSILDLITDPGASTSRRGSLRQDYSIPTPPSRDSVEESSGPRRRRVSVRAAAPQFTPTLATVVAGTELQITATAARENRMTMLSQPPPPYTETTTDEEVQKPRTRRYSPAPGDPAKSTGPVPRLFSRMRKESSSNAEDGDSRRSSLTDVVIDNFKDKT